MDPTGKRPPPCFEYANKGKCPFKDCKYSHDAGDIKEYLRLKAMGKEKFETEQSKHRVLGQQYSSRGAPPAKTPYPRPEMKSGSSLRGSGSTARNL